MSARSRCDGTLERAHVLRLPRARDCDVRRFEHVFNTVDKSAWRRDDVVVCVFVDDGGCNDSVGLAALYSPDIAFRAHQFANPLSLGLNVTDRYKNAFDALAYVLAACRQTACGVMITVGVTDAGLVERVGRVDRLAHAYDILFVDSIEPDMVRVKYSDTTYTMAWADAYAANVSLSQRQRYELALFQNAGRVHNVLHTIAIEHSVQHRVKVRTTLGLADRYLSEVFARYDDRWNVVLSQPSGSRPTTQTTLAMCASGEKPVLMARLRQLQRDRIVTSVRNFPLADRLPPLESTGKARWLFGADLRPPRLYEFAIGVVLALHTKLAHFELLSVVEWVPETRALGYTRLAALLMAARQSIRRAVVRHDAPFKNTRRRAACASDKLNPVDKLEC